MNNHVDTILFDLDDTLMEELNSAEESFIETIRQAGLQINDGEFLKTIQKQAKENWYKLPTIKYCLKIGISSREGLWADFTGANKQLAKLRELSGEYRFKTWNQTLCKFNINDAKMADMLSLEFKRIRNSKHILFPETTDTLTRLKNKFKIGLITNGAPDLQWKKINAGNLKHFFNQITISGEHGYAKPDKRIFDTALKGLKSSRSSTIMVGNNLITDIKGGQDFGLMTIWINRNGTETNEIKPHYEVKNLSDIDGILTALLT